MSLSIIIVLHDQEVTVARIIRGALQAAREVVGPDEPIELIAVDERSSDNTLSHLSILQHKLPELRVIEARKRGRGIQAAVQVARGQSWLIVDHSVEPRILLWGIQALRDGHRAAVVSGEVLGISRDLGTRLSKLRGGLVAAEQTIAKTLASQGVTPAWGDVPQRGLKRRMAMLLRRSVDQVGLIALADFLGVRSK